MPYISALLFAITAFAAALLSALGAVSLFLYNAQWRKAFLRYCGNRWNGTKRPSLSINPSINKKVRFRAKILSVVALILLVVFAAAAYLVSAKLAGDFEFWHVWNWFV